MKKEIICLGIQLKILCIKGAHWVNNHNKTSRQAAMAIVQIVHQIQHGNLKIHLILQQNLIQLIRSQTILTTLLLIYSIIKNVLEKEQLIHQLVATKEKQLQPQLVPL